MDNIYLGLLLAGLIAYLVTHRLIKASRDADDTDAEHKAMAAQQRRDTTQLSSQLDTVTDELASIDSKLDKIRDVLPGRMHKMS